MKTANLGTLVALEMNKIVDSPEHVKMFHKQASMNCCPADCDCQVSNKCPCKNNGKNCLATCKPCASKSDAEPLDKKSAVTQATALILKASEILDNAGLVKSSITVLRSLASEDENDVRMRDLLNPSADLVVQEDDEPFLLSQELEELEQDPDYFEPELMVPEAREIALALMEEKDQERLQDRLNQQLAEWENESLEGDSSISDELEARDSSTLRKLELPSLEEDSELGDFVSSELASKEEELVTLLDWISEIDEENQASPTDPSDLDLELSFTDPEELADSVRRAFSQLDTLMKRADKKDKDLEDSEELEESDFEDED